MSKQHNWASYDRGNYIIEIIIRDGSGAKNESFKFNPNDKRRVKDVLKIMNVKYGIDICSIKGDDFNQDLEWLKKIGS